MKLSNKGRYGVQAIFDIAFHNLGGPTQVRTIAERQAIPPRFLEQIFQDLKRAGLVSSKRGPRGGYQLAKAPDEIRIGDIVRALEGPIVLNSTKDDDSASADATSREVTAQVFDELAERLEACLDETSIAQMCERGEALGYRRGPPSKYNYVI